VRVGAGVGVAVEVRLGVGVGAALRLAVRVGPAVRVGLILAEAGGTEHGPAGWQLGLEPVLCAVALFLADGFISRATAAITSSTPPDTSAAVKRRRRRIVQGIPDANPQPPRPPGRYRWRAKEYRPA